MLGRREDRASGIMRRALEGFVSPIADFSHDRYSDLAVFEGNWLREQRITSMVIEHENDILEFQGTISDLLRSQAHQKVAVFYDETATVKKTEYQKKVADVFDYFNLQGFSEASSTEYLIVFGPMKLKDAGIGDWCAMHFTYGGRHSIEWLSFIPERKRG